MDGGKETGKMAGADHPGVIDEHRARGQAGGLPGVRVEPIEVEQEPGNGEGRDTGTGLQFGGGGGLHGTTDDRMSSRTPGFVGNSKAARLPSARDTDDGIDQIAAAAQRVDHEFLLGCERRGVVHDARKGADIDDAAFGLPALIGDGDHALLKP